MAWSGSTQPLLSAAVGWSTKSWWSYEPLGIKSNELSRMRSAQPLLRNRELTARWSWICKIGRWLTCHLQHHGAPLPAVSREPRGDVRGHLPLPRHFSPVAHSARWVPPLGEDPRRLQGGSTLRWWAERDVVPPPTSLPSPRHPRHGHPGSHHSAFFFFLATAKPPDGRSIANRPPPPVPVQDGVWGGAAAAPLGTPATGAAAPTIQER